MAYTDPDLITDETTTAETILAGMMDRLNAALDLPDDEGWEPAEGSPETSMAEAVGIVLATGAAIALDAERTDFAGFGEIVLGIERTHSEPAIGYSRWSFNKVGDYLIPDGSEFTMQAVDGSPIGYATVGDVTVSGVEATDVQAIALEPGVAANGLLGAAIDWEPLPFVVGVEMTTAPTGGTEDQTRDEYVDVVARRARRMKIVPIVTDDYADTAVDVPAVAAALAVRHLDAEAYPGPPASEGHVTVFTRDANGQANAAGVGTEVVEIMQGEDRPLSVTVHHGDPTFTDLTIAVSIRVALDADEEITTAAVAAAIESAYDPAVYAFDPAAPGNWRPPLTVDDRTITRYDVAGLVDDLPGVARIVDVTINGGESVVLDGWAPLPHLTATPIVTVV